jgi:hypothetical protein
MTLEPYDSQELDRLALRLLDISGKIRSMSLVVSDAPHLAGGLHGRKARQWITQLERWAAESAARLEVALLLAKGQQAALKKVQKSGRKR